MAPNREQWVQMWDDIISIEKVLNKFSNEHIKVMRRIKRIKDLIQMVIGQMENK